MCTEANCASGPAGGNHKRDRCRQSLWRQPQFFPPHADEVASGAYSTVLGRPPFGFVRVATVIGLADLFYDLGQAHIAGGVGCGWGGLGWDGVGWGGLIVPDSQQGHLGCHRLARMNHQWGSTTRRPLAAMCTQMCRPFALMCTLGCQTCRRRIKQRMTARCRPLAAGGC